MKLFNILTFGAAAIILASCSSEVEKTGSTNLKGQLKNYKGGVVVLNYLGMNKLDVIDTIDVDEDGNFDHKTDINELAFYRVSLGPQNFFNVIIDKSDNLTIDANANNLGSDYIVTGSNENDRLNTLNQNLGKLYGSADSLRGVLQNAQASGNAVLFSSISQQQNLLMNEIGLFLKSFIDAGPSSLSSLAALQSLDPDKDVEYFKKVEQGLSSKIPNSPYYLDLKNKVAQFSRLAIGSTAPDIELNDPNGNPVKLSSLKGKVVLIDFWASWCKPCRMENPNVVRMYGEYKSKGFEIFGVSLDKTKDAWVNAIAQDQLTWVHVSDLKFWSSAAAKLYNISSIPKTFLIDAEGNIIGKNLRGPSLEAKLAEVLG